MPRLLERDRAISVKMKLHDDVRKVLEELESNGTLVTAAFPLIAEQFGVKVSTVSRMVGRMRGDIKEVKAKTGVFAVEESKGSKTGPVSVTYVAQQSCPRTCAFLNHGCYAENGFIGGMITKRLNRNTAAVTPLELARNEAAAIDQLSGKRDLRLHIVGDSTTFYGTAMLANAVDRYIARGSAQGCTVRVWTYTHAWRVVPRSAWGAISVLASCETVAQVADAARRGYAAALVVHEHPQDQRLSVQAASLYGPVATDILPCPEQTRGVSCADCRLCTDDQRLLREGISIGFAVHGKRHVAAAALAAENL